MLLCDFLTLLNNNIPVYIYRDGVLVSRLPSGYNASRCFFSDSVVSSVNIVSHSIVSLNII